MALLDEPSVSGRADAQPTPTGTTIDLTSEDARAPDVPAPADHAVGAHARAPARAADDLDRPLVASGRLPVQGLRIRRVRLGSVAVVAAVFWSLGFVVTVGTLVALWHLAQAAGVIADVQDLVVTSLGLERFEIDGSGLLRLASIAAAVVASIGWLLTVLLAAVYNATSALFGGLAVEARPIERHVRRAARLRRLFTPA